MTVNEERARAQSTISRNVFYILFVGAHRVVEINKPNENETEPEKKNKHPRKNFAHKFTFLSGCNNIRTVPLAFFAVLHSTFFFFLLLNCQKYSERQCSRQARSEFGKLCECSVPLKCINPIRCCEFCL